MRRNFTLLLCLISFTAFGQTAIDPPAGTIDGLNILSETSAVFRLRAPGKSQVHLRGDFNGWVIEPSNAMHQSVDGNTWWLQVDGLEPGEYYRYHYLIDGVLEVGDPYAELVVDPWNDGYIPADHWPGMPGYPTGQANWHNAVFRTDEVPFAWTDGAYERPAQDRLLIYEVLLRDFDGGQTYQDVIDRLDHLQWLGITAIELMPVSEFEGNLSWGYNPNFRFAPDKYYGTPEQLKALVNACHERGMAVLLDIVPNHGFGSDPLARMYLNGDGSIAENNPWFNEVAMHPYSPGYDYNHGDPWTREFWKRVFDHWIEEYHIDGYRIDLSKGLTQQYSGSDVGAWNAYDQGRVDVLFEYANHIWSEHPGTFLILEHLGGNAEETVLANGGFMLWGKMTDAYKQAALGYGADLSWGLHTARGWNFPNLVTYFESHDEERIAHEMLTYGASSGDYSAAQFETAMERLALAHAFLFALPGPKMMWQWGEMGYDISIFDCMNGTFSESCKLDEKPERWWYLDDPDRRALAKKVAAIGRLKRDQPAFNGWDFNADLGGQLKRIRLYNPGQNAVLLGNFGLTGGTIVPGFPYAGTWYDYFTGEAIVENDLSNAWFLAPGELRILIDQPLPVPDIDGNAPIAYAAGCTDEAAANYDAEADADDGSCVYDVTLAVGFEDEPAAPHVAGTFNGWDPGALPLAYSGESGRYEAVIQLGIGEGIEYKFLAGAEWGTDEQVPAACGVGVGVLNRSFELMPDLASPGAVCFGECSDCAPAGSAYCGPGTVWDANLLLCLPEESAPVCVEDVNSDGTVGISDLLQLLGAFGNSCL